MRSLLLALLLATLLPNAIASADTTPPGSEAGPSTRKPASITSVGSEADHCTRNPKDQGCPTLTAAPR